VIGLIARTLRAIGLEGIDDLVLGERMSKKNGGEPRSAAPQACASAEPIHASKDKPMLSDDDVAERGFFHEPSQTHKVSRRVGRGIPRPRD
jgi:hypothetical protein